MKESEFVERNREKWKSFEKMLDSGRGNPEDLREQFIQITDDLSYSRTFYKNRSVRVYLNSLGQKIYHRLYKNKRNQFKAFKTFVLKDIPSIAYESRMAFLLGFLTILLGILTGWLTTYYNPEFPSSFFGPAYVNQTIENIKSGNPLGVYKNPDAYEMFLHISINNLKVAFLVFAAGLIFSVGSMFITFYNGIMLGVFIYFFYQYNVIMEFHLTVWMHGTIEILSLVIECGAGILLGKGLLFPGTFTRSKAFFIHARKATLLMLTVIPFILFAAFVESFLTRFTDIPDFFRVIFILSSLGLMLGYFVAFPFRLYHNKILKTEYGEDEITEDVPFQIDFKRILSTGETFLQSIRFMIEKSKKLLFLFALTAFILTIFVFYLEKEEIFNKLIFVIAETENETVANILLSLRNIPLLLNFGGYPLQLFFVLFSIAVPYLITAIKINPYLEEFGFANNYQLMKRTLICLPLLIVWLCLPLTDNLFLKLVYFATIPLIFLYLNTTLFKPQIPVNSFSILFTRLFHTYMNFGIFLLTLLVFLVLIFSPLLLLGLGLLNWIFHVEAEFYHKLVSFILTFIELFCLLLGFTYLSITSVFITFSNTEIKTALFLKKKIEKMTLNKKAYGQEAEN